MILNETGYFNLPYLCLKGVYIKLGKDFSVVLSDLNKRGTIFFINDRELIYTWT